MPSRLPVLLLGLVLVALLAGVLALSAGSGQAQGDETPTPTPVIPPLIELNVDIIRSATVLIMQTYDVGGQAVISCVGSGTLVSADGLILTNAHLALPGESCPSDTIVIAITVRLDEPPVPIYTAEVVDASQGLDVAVLRISRYLDGRVVEPGTLQLPFVELGDSTAVQLDDTITVVGYPSLGNEPVAATRGTVTSFTAETRAGDRAWIRTGATIPGTMSGGGAYNREGKLIGIPTIAPSRVAGEAVDCRVIQDSNGDGRADQDDQCVPVGGFITAVRPMALARGLVRAAALGIVQGEDYTPGAAPSGGVTPTFSRPFFTTRINEAGVPANVVSAVPGGAASLYLVFDYSHMTDGLVYELRVTRNDVPAPDYGLPPATWSGGERGTWYIGRGGIPWDNGEYDFRLLIEGREVASQTIQVGVSPQSEAGFSDIVFGLPDADGNLSGTGYVLPEGAAIAARFNYRNMSPERSWTFIWYFDGQELLRDTQPWADAPQGVFTMPATAQFLPGPYRLDLYVDNRLSATADFVIAGGAEASSAVMFSDFRFTTAAQGEAPRQEFPAGIERLYAFFNWRLIAPGTLWTRRWTVDGDILFEVTEPWDAPPEGQDYYVSLDSLSALPDGTYGLEIRFANVHVASAAAKVGLGQLPVGAFASAEGVQMIGRITDAETGQGIPGAMFIVLESEFSVEDFLWDQTQVLGLSMADSEGRFQIPVLLPRGTMEEPLLYSVLVRAEGYLPLNTDGIPVLPGTESPIEMNIELSRN